MPAFQDVVFVFQAPRQVEHAVVARRKIMDPTTLVHPLDGQDTGDSGLHDHCGLKEVPVSLN